MTPRTRALAMSLFTAALLGAGACGGNTSGGGGGSGNLSGTGGSGNLSGTGGSGNLSGSGGTGNLSGAGGSGNVSGAGGGTCAPGAPCSTPGATCTPADVCCPCTYTCEGGSWTAYACPDCPVALCPTTPPTDGAPCGPCDIPFQPCVYQTCITASCVAGKWQVDITPCPPPPPCGYDANSQPCAPGYLCVYPGGLGDPAHCEPNPCMPGQNVSCDCAGSLCTYGYCSNANFQSVWCECPNC